MYFLGSPKLILLVGVLLCVGACEKTKSSLPVTQEDVVKTEETIHVEQIQIARMDASIVGELWVPTSVDAPPLVVLIAGSGPTDMDGNSVAGIHTNMFRQLAGELGNRGIATFRYDKRGVGKSTITATESDLTIHTFADDAVAVVQHFDGDARFSKRFVAGHSEGGLLALLASPSLNLDGIVLLATAGRSLDAILIEQLSKQVPAMMPEIEAILESLGRGESVPNPPPLLAALFRPSVQPFLMSELTIDPTELLEGLKIQRVLIVQGAHDVQVSVLDAELLKASKTSATLVILPAASHIFKDEPSTLMPQASYTNPDLPLSPGFVDAVYQFVQ